MAKLKNKIDIVEPTIGYEDAFFSVSATTQGANNTFAVSVSLLPYRTLPSGEIEKAPDSLSFSYSSRDAKNKGDKAIQDLANDVEKAIDKFLAIKGK